MTRSSTSATPSPPVPRPTGATEPERSRGTTDRAWPASSGQPCTEIRLVTRNGSPNHDIPGAGPAVSYEKTGSGIGVDLAARQTPVAWPEAGSGTIGRGTTA